jgi:IclR family transcriptional regulator, KDG regulon repressor
VGEPIRAVERALDVLSCFRPGDLALSLTQIADQLTMPKSTVFRLLATLESKRYLHRNASTGLYHLGLRLIELGALASQDLDVHQWAQPYLERLAAEHGETVDLAVLDGANVIYLQVVESPQRVRLAAAVGQRLPAFCTASGKAFLAYLPFAQVAKLVAGSLVQYTEHTHTQPDDLAHDLQATRARGFAMSEQEYEKDINAVGAPVLNAQQFPILSLSITGPSFRLSRERMLALGPVIRATTETMALEAGMLALSAIASGTTSSGLTGRKQERYL